MASSAAGSGGTTTTTANGSPSASLPSSNTGEDREPKAQVNGLAQHNGPAQETKLAEPATSPASTAEVATSDSKQHDVTIEKHEAVAIDEEHGEAADRPNEKTVSADAETEGTEKVEDVDDESKYLSGFPLLVLVVALCLTTFLIGLDQMVIATAIPKITSQFHSLDDVGWYGSAYLLTTTSLQPSYGKVYTYFNVKYSFIAAMIIFELGSVVCAVAQNSPTLVVGRAIAGAGAAGLFSGGMTIVGYSVPLRKRAIYIASLSSMFGISSIVGPILGGVFTDKLTWRWCFWINLPFGGAAIAVVLFFFRNPERTMTNITFKEKILALDLPGAFFLITAITCLLLALQWGGITYPWSESKVWGCIIGFGLLISIFVVIQLRQKQNATIPPRILTQRSVLAAALTLIFMSMGIYTHIFYLPFYFQAVKGTTAEESGIRCIAYLISNTVASLINGGLVTAVGYYAPFIPFGIALFAVGSGLLHTLRVSSPHATWIGYQVLAGYGSGAIQLPFIAVQAAVGPDDMPTANAIAIFCNTLGGAVAISAAQNIFTSTLLKQLAANVRGVDPAAVVAAGATHVRDAVPAPQVSAAIQAYDVAVTTAFILPIVVAGIAFCTSWLFEWKSVKGKNLLATAAA